MKLLIDIPDEEYKHIVNPSDQEKTLYHGRWFDMIRSGIPYTDLAESRTLSDEQN